MKSQRVYLEDILSRIERIEHIIELGLEAIESDLNLQDALYRNFEIIGEITKRLQPSVTHMRPEIPWREIAGFRDRLIHDYDDIRLEIVWETAQTDI